VIGDGYAVCIAAQVGEDLLWSREWALGVDDPRLFEQGITKSGEVFAKAVVGVEVDVSPSMT